MHYLKDLFEGKATERAHEKFIRYSKGEFEGPLLKAKFNKKENFRLFLSFHYNNEVLDILGDYLKGRRINIEGNLIWNRDLSSELEEVGIKYVKVTKSRGIYKYKLNNVVDIHDFIKKFNKYNLLINIREKDLTFITKDSFPKPNKELSPDFCKVLLPNELRPIIFKEFLFDVKDDNKIKEIRIRHDIIINDIEIPNLKDFEEARRKAKRKGYIIRYVTIDNKDKKPVKKEFFI